MRQRSTDVKAAARSLEQSLAQGTAGGEVKRADTAFTESGPAATHPGDVDAGEKKVDAAALDEDFHKRIDRLERQNFRVKLALVVMVMVVGYMAFHQAVSQGTIIKQTLMESRELKLLDNDGNARLFLRMYSRVPVLQLLDSGGKPRMSLGMRFDDTPFIDLSDRTGRTRATLELTEKDEPALSLFDEKGEPTFKIN